MSDQEKRARERKAKAGDPSAAAAVERDQARYGEGVLGFLDELVGKQIYIEGARINYRGVLQAVLRHGDGTPAGLVGRFQRVSYMGKDGPDRQWTFVHSKPRLVPYEMVHDVGEEGFEQSTPGKWST